MLDLELESSACVFNTTVPLELVFNGVFFFNLEVWKDILWIKIPISLNPDYETFNKLPLWALVFTFVKSVLLRE